jgi:hypothetical protein
MSKLSKDLGAGGTLHPRETLYVAGTLGSNGAEVVIQSDGCSGVSLDLRVAAAMSITVEGTVDGSNWTTIPVRQINVASVLYLATITYTTAGVWWGSCAGYRQIRARVSAYTSGAATATLAATLASIDWTLSGSVTPTLATTTAAAGVAATLTLASPGAGLRHYLTYLSINRFAAALLTAAAAPVVVTTANLPGSLAFSVPADAAAQGTLDRWREDFAFPLVASAQGTATTIVCPATTSVIWRVTAGYYVAP